MSLEIITVSGASSGSGKTMIAERLLKTLKGWSALKVTVVHSGACPTGRDCGACEGLNSEYMIVSDKNKLDKKGKDTMRLKKAGARKVLWLKARPEGLKRGLKDAVSRFSAYGGKGTRGLVIEGTSILKHIKPALAIFVKRKNSALKPSAKEALSRADLVLTLPLRKDDFIKKKTSFSSL